MIQVFLADDHAIVRDGMRKHINEQLDMRVVGECGDGGEVLERAQKEHWDLLLLDLSLPTVPGIEIVEKLRVLKPSLPIIVLSMYPENQHGPHLMRMGASAYLSKGRAPLEILTAIRRVASGKQYLTAEVAGRLNSGQEAPHEKLSPRELEILRLFCRGTSPSDIATALDVSQSTVSTYLSRIRDKLGVESNAAMIQYASREHLAE
jgi:DNA-binding NarL/FixJ family response regulator